MTAEEVRLEETRAGKKSWRRWGPYVSERQWGTVREDYSADGSAWEYFTHDQARSRAYRWGEDGIAGISDEQQHGKEGNHGEDVKEYYFYLDNVPSHAYMKFLYKYPQRAFPYADLVAENGRRTRDDPEYELLDTGIFEDDKYFDVFVEYAKAAPEDILIRVSVANRGPELATLHVLPTLWFMNDWTWFPGTEKPHIAIARSDADGIMLEAKHRTLEPYWLYCEPADEALFTENESNTERLYGVPNATPYVKDAFHECVVTGHHEAVNPARSGTKAAVHYVRRIAAGATAVIRLRLSNAGSLDHPLAQPFDDLFEQRRREAD
nr:glucosidase [Burkholderiales bacterium]